LRVRRGTVARPVRAACQAPQKITPSRTHSRPARRLWSAAACRRFASAKLASRVRPRLAAPRSLSEVSAPAGWVKKTAGASSRTPQDAGRLAAAHDGGKVPSIGTGRSMLRPYEERSRSSASQRKERSPRSTCCDTVTPVGWRNSPRIYGGKKRFSAGT
jgi:hypothetical protein